MPRGKMYDSTLGAERTVYHRAQHEVYGPSSIWLEPLEKEKSVLNIDGNEIWLPVLDVQKYYPNAKCYALVEKLAKRPITMVDVLYSFEDISKKLDDDKFLEYFLKQFSRERINKLNLLSPALTISPQDPAEAKKFHEARKRSIQDAFYSEIFCFGKMEEEKIEIEDAKKVSEQMKEDSIALDFIKSLYEAISRKPVKRPNSKKTKMVDATLIKELRMLKSGATIVPGEVVGKYFSAYAMKLNIGEKDQEVNDTIGIYIGDLDDVMFRTSQDEIDIERKNRFGNDLDESKILETFLRLFAQKEPLMLFAGKYSEEERKIMVDRKTEKYFDEMNELLVPSKTSNDGR